jgi:hypothetical protein
MRPGLGSAVLIVCVLAAPLPPAIGQEAKFDLVGGDIQDRANAVLTLMSFSVTPDATASSLSINSNATGDPGIVVGQRRLHGGHPLPPLSGRLPRLQPIRSDVRRQQRRGGA